MADPLVAKNAAGTFSQVRVGSDGGLMLSGASAVSGLTGLGAASVSASAVTDGEITVSANTTKKFVFGAYTNPDLHLHYRVDDDAGAGAATSISTSQGFVPHGGSFSVAAGATALTVYWALFDGEGTAATGGAADRIYVSTL